MSNKHVGYFVKYLSDILWRQPNGLNPCHNTKQLYCRIIRTALSLNFLLMWYTWRFSRHRTAIYFCTSALEARSSVNSPVHEDERLQRFWGVLLHVFHNWVPDASCKVGPTLFICRKTFINQTKLSTIVTPCVSFASYHGSYLESKHPSSSP